MKQTKIQKEITKYVYVLGEQFPDISNLETNKIEIAGLIARQNYKILMLAK